MVQSWFSTQSPPLIDMAGITIDLKKCNKDLICVAECPFLLFREDEGGFPVFSEESEEMCIDCGHCLAVCPAEAVSFDNLNADDCEPVVDRLAVSQEQVTQLFRSRRSIRVFKNRPAEQSAVKELVDITRWAPTARNVQPVSWIVINNRTEVRRLADMVIDYLRGQNQLPGIISIYESGKDIIHRDAPCLIVAHAASTGFRPVEDCTIALTTFEAAAPVFGLGSCWAGFFMRAASDHEPILEYLDLPAGHQPYGALLTGYPKFRYKRIPPRKDARIDWRT